MVQVLTLSINTRFKLKNCRPAHGQENKAKAPLIGTKSHSLVTTRQGLSATLRKFDGDSELAQLRFCCGKLPGKKLIVT